MSQPAIIIENLSKQYRLGDVGTGTLSHDLKRWWYALQGKEDPFAKVGETNDRTQKGNSEYVWALKDINFQINQGDAVGIIGRNGAGKSTLLKLLSKTTAPTTGSIKVKGRIASLLEVGTGFHPELSGRDNIYLNGAILGMRKREIDRKLDEIVDFAGIERYLDTPVKRYSSGMYVRLAFAVAAHLDSDILIVDEVLAVGDAEFQKKCLGKMGEVSKGQGRTVLFVSHNMASIRELCSKSVLLEFGKIADYDNTLDVIRRYLSNSHKLQTEKDFQNDQKLRRGNAEARFVDVVINNGDEFLEPDRSITISCRVKVLRKVHQLFASFLVRGNETSEPITSSGIQLISTTTLREGAEVTFSFVIPPNSFRTGLFPLYLWLGKPKELAGDHYPYDVLDSVYYLNIASNKNESELGYNPLQPAGYFNIKATVEKINIIE